MLAEWSSGDGDKLPGERGVTSCKHFCNLFRIWTWLELVHKGWVSSQEVGQGDKCLKGGVPALAAGGVVHAVGEVVAIVAAAGGVSEGVVGDQGVLDTGHPGH